MKKLKRLWRIIFPKKEKSKPYNYTTEEAQRRREILLRSNYVGGAFGGSWEIPSEYFKKSRHES